MKDRQCNNNNFFLEQIEITFSGVKFTLFFFFVLFCFVFLYLIPARRQLPKLLKFPGVVLRCCLHPSRLPSKKYVCKQTFDCCRECNHAFYTCFSMVGYTYGACMHGAYKCMCDCIDQKSYSELPYKLPTPTPTNKPTATTPTVKP